MKKKVQLACINLYRLKIFKNSSRISPDKTCTQKNHIIIKLKNLERKV